jgi:antitoxin Phd
MPNPSKRPTSKRAKSSVWEFDEARTKFVEIVRRAQNSGPQYVTMNGKKAVAVINADDLERLLPKEKLPLVEFLESIYAPGLDLERDPDTGRDAAL